MMKNKKVGNNKWYCGEKVEKLETSYIINGLIELFWKAVW